MKHTGTPYLAVVDQPRVMKGTGAPRQMVFGVLGHTKETGKTRVLGGLVQHTPDAPIGKGTVDSHPKLCHTERHITGPASKTHVPGAHYGQVPYPGLYRSMLGKSL